MILTLSSTNQEAAFSRVFRRIALAGVQKPSLSSSFFCLVMIFVFCACLKSVVISFDPQKLLLHCRNEPAAAATPGPSIRLSMWGRDPAEPSAVPQDGAGSKPHAAAEPGPTSGSEPRSTSGLPGEHRPQRMAPSCQHLHQQQVGTDARITRSTRLESFCECR